MTLKEVVVRACQEPSLVDALTWIAIWESERIVAQALRNDKNPDGSKWDTCFKFCFSEVMAAWTFAPKKGDLFTRPDGLVCIIGEAHDGLLMPHLTPVFSLRTHCGYSIVTVPTRKPEEPKGPVTCAVCIANQSNA